MSTCLCGKQNSSLDILTQLQELCTTVICVFSHVICSKCHYRTVFLTEIIVNSKDEAKISSWWTVSRRTPYTVRFLQKAKHTSNMIIPFDSRQEIEKKPYEPSSSIIVECWDSLVWNLSYFPTPRNRFLVRKSTTSVVAERISQDSSIQSTSLPKLVCAICRRYHLDIMCMVWWLVEWIEWYLDYIFLALSPSFPQL